LHLRCKCRCIGVAGKVAAVEASELSFAGGQHALPYRLARLACAIGGKFFVIDARHVAALCVSKRSSSGPEILFW
jgi:hypothetical protein